MHMGTKRSTLLVAFLLSALLAGCGPGSSVSGSDGGTTPPLTPTPTSYTLQVIPSGSGSVSSNPAGIDCPANCSKSFPPGTLVELTATPATGYNFSGWSGVGISCPSTGTCTVSMMTARTVTATFSQTAAANYTLTVTLDGSGSGTPVELTATPAKGYTFSGWSISGVSCPAPVCTVPMSAARNAVASFAGSLCDGLITDKVNHPMTPTALLAKPAKLQTVTDPEFGTTIRRISDVVTDYGVPGVIKPAYSTIPAWNADESYLILYHTDTGSPGHHLYNGKTYAHIRQLNIDPPDLEQFYWHASDPDILFYVDASNRLIRYHVGSSTKEVVKAFSCGGTISGGDDPMYMSWDSNVIGLRCSSGFVFGYRISTDSVGTTFASTSGLAPDASASGTLMFFANSTSEPYVYDFDMGYARTLNIANPFDHASLGRLANGNDTHNAVDFDGAQPGSLVVNDMTDASTRVVVGEATGYPYPPSGHHLSSVAFQAPGWVAVSIVGTGDGQTVLDNELLLADTNPGGKVCRVAHHRSLGKEGPNGYWAEPHVVISPSGTRLLFGSDWGGGSSVDSYVVELPSYQP
jgi:hypothetical protein